MIKLLDLLITKIEKCTKDNLKKDMYRNILNIIDKYKYKKYKIETFRYYRFKNFEIDMLRE